MRGGGAPFGVAVVVVVVHPLTLLIAGQVARDTPSEPGMELR